MFENSGSSSAATFDFTIPRGDTGATGGLGSVVTSLPASPVSNEEVYYLADSTNGIVWHLKYRSGSSSTYKWEFVGGASLYSAVDTEQSTTSATYAALTTAGPSVTVPLAGDYIISFGSMTFSAGTNIWSFHSFDVGGTTASDNDALEYRNAIANAPRTTQSRNVRKTGLSASTALVSKYRSSAAGTSATFGSRWMQVTPIRVA